jgi:DNA-directed RNA polymerase subunit L
LCSSPEVMLCGYTIPHPSEATMHFRIQTTGPHAVDVLKQGIKDLEKLCDHTLTVFQVKSVAVYLCLKHIRKHLPDSKMTSQNF